MEELVGSLSLKEVSSGANLVLWIPYDDGVWYGTKTFSALKRLPTSRHTLICRASTSEATKLHIFFWNRRSSPDGDAQHYLSIEVQAARGRSLELAHLLGQYRRDVVLVGGWAPELLFPGAELVHVGSLDVDLALNHRSRMTPFDRTIHECWWVGDTIRCRRASRFNTSARCQYRMGNRSSSQWIFWQVSTAAAAASTVLNKCPACSHARQGGATLSLQSPPRSGSRDAAVGSD